MPLHIKKNMTLKGVGIMGGTTNAMISAVGDVVGIFTTNVVPLITTTPFVYFLGASLFGLGCGVFAKVRHII